MIGGACLLLVGTILPWVRFEGCCENSGKFLEQRVLEEDGGWILLVIALAAAGAGFICLYLPRLWQRVAAAFGLILGAVAVLATIIYTDPDVLVTASYTALPGRIVLWSGALAVVAGSIFAMLAPARVRWTTL